MSPLVDKAIIVVGALVEVGSIAAVVSLWRGPGRVLPKLLWTLVTLVAFFGILAYAVWHDPPPPSDPIDRPPERDWDVPPRI
jgi:hypothetical protein